MSKNEEDINSIKVLVIQLLINEAFTNHTLERIFRKYRIFSDGNVLCLVDW